jgi:uncharacterized membrane protein YozB (DUF420 family)
MIAITEFPAINATLNATSAVLLITGRRLIAHRRIEAHKKTMITAFITSTLFLCCYLYYHAHVGSRHFTGPNPWRTIYYAILLTHTVLAVVIVPLILMSLSRGLKRQDAKHRAIARIAYPLWLYVSVTGVVIYIMLYRITY